MMLCHPLEGKITSMVLNKVLSCLFSRLGWLGSLLLTGILLLDDWERWLNMMAPSGSSGASSSESIVNHGPQRSGADAGPSSLTPILSEPSAPSLPSETDSDKELFFSAPPSLSSTSSSSTSTTDINSAPNKGENEEHYSFTPIEVGSEAHEAMKDGFIIRILRGKLAEWEAEGQIDGLHIKRRTGPGFKPGISPDEGGDGTAL